MGADGVDSGEMARTARLAWGGVLGPAAFILGWAMCGASKPGYSPVDDAISRLAADGADTRIAMTAAFVAYAVGLLAYGVALRRAGGWPGWVAAWGSGLATLGVALTPLDVSDTVDTLHGIAAGSGYAAIALIAVLAVRPHLERSERGWALAAGFAGVVAAVALVLTTVSEANGLYQRLGLTAGDLWIMASATRLARRSLAQAG